MCLWKGGLSFSDYCMYNVLENSTCWCSTLKLLYYWLGFDLHFFSKCIMKEQFDQNVPKS